MLVDIFGKCRFPLLVLLMACLGLASCSRRPASTADVPRKMPFSYQVTVAPFSQPVDSSQLIQGTLPENQGRIPPDALADLDMALKELLLKDAKRQYTFLAPSQLPLSWREIHSASQPGALKRWVEFGRSIDAQYILVPQVLNWHERQGSEAGVTSSAEVRVEFFLINVKEGLPRDRSIYEEKQIGLIDNLFTVGDFVKRKGKWVTATDLAVEGMKNAIRDIGL